MTKDEVLRLALEALENLGNHDHVCPQWPTYAEPENYPKCNCGYDQAITAIKAALEAKDEPVAWRYDQAKYRTNDLRGRQWAFNVFSQAMPYMDEMVQNVTPLYTTPPQRKPLTDEEIYLCTNHIDRNARGWANEFARAIEAAHGITGENK
jgi:hypothetical protein